MLLNKYAEYMKGITLKDGIISFTQPISDEDARECSEILRNDLLAYQIPHCKVAGAWISNAGIQDFVTKTNMIDRSLAELIPVFDELVWSDLKGTAISPNYTLKVSEPESVGYLISMEESVVSDDSSLFYCGLASEKMSSCLNCNKKVVELKGSAVLYLAITRGQGYATFADNSARTAGTSFVPFRQVFDLTKFFNVTLYEEGSKVIRIGYSQKIHEDVLTKILHDYADDILRGEV